nr:1485_t:CDS:2 [Entrophospora candida]
MTKCMGIISDSLENDKCSLCQNEIRFGSEELEEIEGVKDNESLRLVRLYNKAGKIQKNYHRSETIRDYSLVQFLGRI